MTLNIVVLRTDEGTVGEFLWDILLCRKDKGNHRERFTLEKLLIFSTFFFTVPHTKPMLSATKAPRPSAGGVPMSCGLLVATT